MHILHDALRDSTLRPPAPDLHAHGGGRTLSCKQRTIQVMRALLEREPGRAGEYDRRP